MAIALPLIVELFHSLDRAVQWLSGGDPASGQTGQGGRAGPRAHAHAHESREPQGGPGSGGAQRLCMPSHAPVPGTRQWGGPLRLHPARRVYRTLHLPH